MRSPMLSIKLQLVTFATINKFLECFLFKLVFHTVLTLTVFIHTKHIFKKLKNILIFILFIFVGYSNIIWANKTLTSVISIFIEYT